MNMIQYNSDSKTFFSSAINDSHYITGFSTKILGDAKNLGVIQLFFQEQNIPVKKIVELEQIHSTNIELVKEKEGRLVNLADSDAAITRLYDTALIVKNADCVPIVYADKTTGYVGISHNGWRGSLKKLSSKMVEKFIDLGSDKKEILCGIGPAIGFCCYEVDEDFYYQFREEFEQYTKEIFQFRKGKWHINLLYLNFLLLIESGIERNNIDFFPFCTKCDHRRFFSRRRARNAYFERMFNFVIKTS